MEIAGATTTTTRQLLLMRQLCEMIMAATRAMVEKSTGRMIALSTTLRAGLGRK